MKTTSTPATKSSANKHLLLILLGIAIALISLLALRFEMHGSLTSIFGNVSGSGWMRTSAREAAQWFQAALAILM